jgi:hypothetical protein
MRYRFSFLTLLCLAALTATAQPLFIRILDAQSRAPVPFAAIRLDQSDQGYIADMDGLVKLPASAQNVSLEVSALSYEKRVALPPHDSLILLRARHESLREAVVKPDEEKVRRILRQALARRDAHNPERYEWYGCSVYYKMTADVQPADSSYAADTSKAARAFRTFTEGQHLLLFETFSRRSYRRPQRLQEDILATRFSGFRSPLFAPLVTDVLPFHCYSDYLKLNGRDFRNPLSPGASQWYHYGLRDELMQGTDTLWLISFYPKKTGEALRGVLYIRSDGYAVTNLIASWKDTALGTALGIEQHYTKTGGRWFPHELNYRVTAPVLRNAQDTPKNGYLVVMLGRSEIDSVSFGPQEKSRFDNAHPVRLLPGAGNATDSAWQAFRPAALDAKEQRTYVFMDSLMGALKADRLLRFMENLVDGKIVLGPVDLNVARLYRYNSYEGSRYGLGLQTNNHLLKWMSLGGWTGYGSHDAAWKWGGFAEVYLDPYKETTLRIAYDRDLQDPGRIDISPDLNRSYLLNYFIRRADAVDAWSLRFAKRFGYLSAELGLQHKSVTPQYDYLWLWEGADARNYTVSEASLRLRYAFGERRAPLLGKYFSSGSPYPVVYAGLAAGNTEIAGRSIGYLRTGVAIAWQKHIARIGDERWQLEAGKLWSDAPLPLGQLFAARGIRHEKYPLYLFGGLQTLSPYSYFMDAFLSIAWRHDFDWRFYRANFGSFGSMPGLSLAWNAVWGRLSHASAQQMVEANAPAGCYHEGGILLRDALRMRYLNLCYIGLVGGYFFPLQPSRKDAGTAVIGLSVSY